MKLLAEMKRRSFDWYIDMKRTLATVAKISQEKNGLTMDNINRSTQFISNMMKDLPAIREQETIESRNMRVQQIVNEYLNDLVIVR